MSFKHTKCDLSAGVAKVDLPMLITQMEIRFFTLMGRIRKKASDIQYDNLTPEARMKSVSTMCCTGSDEFIHLSQQLAETTELLHTLYETSDRKIEINR